MYIYGVWGELFQTLFMRQKHMRVRIIKKEI